MSQTAEVETGKPSGSRSPQQTDEIPPPNPVVAKPKFTLKYDRANDQLVYRRYHVGAPTHRDWVNRTLELRWTEGRRKVAEFTVHWFSRFVHYTEPRTLKLVEGNLPFSKVLRTIAKLNDVDWDKSSDKTRNYWLINSFVGSLTVSKDDWEYADGLYRQKSLAGIPTP